jgi:hypothetical protein
MLSIQFEEPNFGADKSKAVIRATAFVGENPTGLELMKYGDNTVGKMIRLEVDANPLGKVVYNFFKNKIFKVTPIRNLTMSGHKMFADWSINPEELKNVFNRADGSHGTKMGRSSQSGKEKNRLRLQDSN